jgi:hypothetical protein
VRAEPSSPSGPSFETRGCASLLRMRFETRSFVSLVKMTAGIPAAAIESAV